MALWLNTKRTRCCGSSVLRDFFKQKHQQAGVFYLGPNRIPIRDMRMTTRYLRKKTMHGLGLNKNGLIIDKWPGCGNADKARGVTVRDGRKTMPILLSMLVLEKLDGHIPLPSPMEGIGYVNTWLYFHPWASSIFAIYYRIQDTVELGVFHQDIACQNIMRAPASSNALCDRHGYAHEWKIIDFGYACLTNLTVDKYCPWTSV